LTKGRSQPVGPGISLPIMGWSELLPGHLLSALAVPPEPSLAALGSVSELIMLCPSAACRVRWSASAHWAMTELSESWRPGLCSRRACAGCRASVIAATRSAMAHGCLFDWVIRTSNLSVRESWPGPSLAR
jgi:hypothetical protein